MTIRRINLENDPEYDNLAPAKPVPPAVHDSHAIPADDAEPVKSCPSCSHCGKTHDLSIRREFGNVVVGTENGEDRRMVYLQEGVAQDLGRALAPLTPAQRQLLIDDLTGGEK